LQNQLLKTSQRRSGASGELSGGAARLTGLEPSLQGEVLACDVSVDGDFFLAASGVKGNFAVPVRVPEAGKSVTIKGSRWDLGLSGNFSTASVPGKDQVLMLSALAFRVLGLSPDKSLELEPSNVFQVMLSSPAAEGVANLGHVKLWKEVPGEGKNAHQKATAKKTVTAKDAKSAKGKKTGREKAGQWVPKRAMGLGLGPELEQELESGVKLVEVECKVSLSLDGKVVTLVPKNIMDLGGVYHVVVDGLASLSGETAPRVEVIYHVKTFPAPSTLVDLSAIKLTYPDQEYNVNLVIPEKAIPALATFEIEGQNMGSYINGFMPDSSSTVDSAKFF